MIAAGATLFFIGFAGIVAAMMFGTTKQGIRSVFFRGSFQEARDYTPFGWRCYKAAAWCAFVRFVLVVVGAFVP